MAYRLYWSEKYSMRWLYGHSQFSLSSRDYSILGLYLPRRASILYMGIARCFHLGNYSYCTLHHQSWATKWIKAKSKSSRIVIPWRFHLVCWCCTCYPNLRLQNWLSNCCSYRSSIPRRQFWYQSRWAFDFDQRLLLEEINLVRPQCLILDPHEWDEGSLAKGWRDHCLHC